MEERVDRLTVAQAAEMLGIGESAVRERIKRGKLPATKTNKGWSIAASDLLEASGLSRGVARYLCQFLASSLVENFREVSEDVAQRAIRSALSELREDASKLVGRLHRELGEKDTLLGIANERIAKLEGDIAAVLGEVERPSRERTLGPPDDV